MGCERNVFLLLDRFSPTSVLFAVPHPNRILIDGANLTISNISVEDQGIYSCSAQTALDSISEKTHVTVLGK